MTRRSIDIDSFAHQNPIPAATRIGPLLVSSIIPPFDAGTRKVPETVAAQVENLFLHIANMLAAAGASFDDVAKITFFVNDIKHRDAINEPWAARFPDAASRPSRHTMVVAGGGPAISCEFTAYIES
jgi:enamine deaminase RidA (YjgF/YER057c/UK114 family)